MTFPVESTVHCENKSFIQLTFSVIYESVTLEKVSESLERSFYVRAHVNNIEQHHLELKKASTT